MDTAPVRISAVKFWFKSPKINSFNKGIKGINKTGVLWRKHLLILLLQLYSLLNSSQHLYHFKSYVQSTSPQFEESAIILHFFCLIYDGEALGWAYNTNKSCIYLKVTTHLVVIMQQTRIVPPAYLASVTQFKFSGFIVY